MAIQSFRCHDNFFHLCLDKGDIITYAMTAPESSITLVSLYPELKSDELVKKQIAVYQENNKKIINLKEKQIDANVAKWWLYFGG